MAGKKTKVGGIYIDLAMNVAKLVASTQESEKVLKGFQGTAQNVATGIKTAFGAIAAGLAVKELKDFSDAIVDLAKKGDAANDIAEAFKFLGGQSSEIDKAKKATLGVVDSFELMRIANKGLLADVKGFESNFGKLTELSARFAQATGIDAKEALEQLTDGLIRGSTKGLKQFGFELEGVKGKIDVQNAVMAQLDTAMNKLPGVTDSFGQAAEALGVQFGEQATQIGQVIDKNDALTVSTRELEKTWGDLDTKKIGEALAGLEGILLSLANVVSSVVVPTFNAFANVLDDVLNSSTVAQLDDVLSKINKAEERAATAAVRLRNTTNRQALHGADPKAVQEAYEEMVQSSKELQALDEQRLKLVEKLRGEMGKGASATDEAAAAAARLKGGQEGAGEAAEKLAEKLQSIRDRLEGELRKNIIDDLKEKLEEAIKAGDTEAFDSIVSQIQEKTAEGIRNGFEELGKIGTSEDMQKLEDYIKAQNQDIADDAAKKMSDAQKKAHEESVQFWQTLFENAITGTTFDLKDALKQVAVGFASQIMAGITAAMGISIPGGLTSPQGLGSWLANQILGSLTSGGTSGVAGGLLSDAASSLGLGNLAGGAGGLMGSFGGGAGVLLDTGAIIPAGSAIPAGATGVGSAAMPGTGMLGSIGPWGAAAAAALIIGSQTDWFGLEGGVSHPETLARNDWAEKIEELIDKAGGVHYFDEEGNRRTVTDIGSRVFDDFNDFDADRDLFGRYGPETSNAFLGIGNALANMYGGEDLAGGQAGIMLATEFGGSIEGLKALVDTLGLSFEDVTEQLMQFGREGKASWLEIVSQIRDSSAAFEEGITGIGQYAQAMDNLLNSDGTGQISLNQLKNIAHEMQEVGINSVEAARAALEATGNYSQAELDALFDSFRMHNITTMDQLEGLDEMGLANIIASMDANLQNAGAGWRESIDGADDYLQKLQEIDEVSEKKLRIEVETSFDSNTRAAMDVGMFGGTGLERIGGSTGTPGYARAMSLDVSAFTRGIMGGVGIPRSGDVPQVNTSSSNVMNSNQFNVVVNAQGSDASVEGRVYDAMDKMEVAIAQMVSEMINEQAQRGRI